MWWWWLNDNGQHLKSRSVQNIKCNSLLNTWMEIRMNILNWTDKLVSDIVSPEGSIKHIFQRCYICKLKRMIGCNNQSLDHKKKSVRHVNTWRPCSLWRFCSPSRCWPEKENSEYVAKRQKKLHTSSYAFYSNILVFSKHLGVVGGGFWFLLVGFARGGGVSRGRGVALGRGVARPPEVSSSPSTSSSSSSSLGQSRPTAGKA